MRDYFESEMRRLHEAAGEFARAHPEQARMLNLNEVSDRDPYIERLLEGMAFLTAGVRERLDRSRVEVSEQLLGQLCPGQVRARASATVMELRPRQWRQTRQTVPAGARIHAPETPERVACTFALTRALTLYPVALHGVQAEDRMGGGTRLELDLRTQGGAGFEAIAPDRLDFFVHADPVLAAGLYALLTDPQARIAVLDERGSARPTADLRFEPIGLGAEGRLPPADDHGQFGLDFLHDYFCFPERYLFLGLTGLDRAEHAGGERLRLRIESAVGLPADHPIGPQTLRLFCVPAVNLWPTEAEPVECDHRREDYRLVADARHRDEILVHSVQAVTARGQRSGEIEELKPLHRRRAGDTARTWQVAGQGDGPARSLHLRVDPGRAPEPETLSVAVLASNGHMPRRHLNEGDIRAPGEDFPGGLDVANITRPSRFQRPPARADYPQRLHGFLAAGMASITEPGALPRLLDLLNWTDRPQHRRRIEAIGAIRARPMNRLRRGILQRGLQLDLELNEEGFLSIADIRLFADVLHAYLRTVAAVNECVALTVTTQPSQQELRWEPRTGRNSPI